MKSKGVRRQQELSCEEAEAVRALNVKQTDIETCTEKLSRNSQLLEKLATAINEKTKKGGTVGRDMLERYR